MLLMLKVIFEVVISLYAFVLMLQCFSALYIYFIDALYDH